MLTTNEYMNLMLNSGYYVSLDADEINVLHDERIVATVDSEQCFVMDTYNDGFYKLSEENKKYVYQKTKEYAETPLVNRESK
ncbi:hypothetical protein [uncultured Vagococcus sp.]|uniref:hypothetical protein n=1 Tax=uncultured Vagococcus sp. TaxID=189676 RepID=UPI002584C175|nr:hypothetical protein [uncultured Vagococcus sp.]